MLSISAPMPYTLPLSLQKNKKVFIAGSVLFLLLGIAPFFCFGMSTDPAGDPVTWSICFLFAVFWGLAFFGVLSNNVRFSEDRISSREWFFWKEIEYARITAVRFYYRNMGRGGSIPILELSGDNRRKIAINLAMYGSPANLWIIYDVLKKKSCQADLGKSPEEFLTVPGETAWRKNILPESYTLPRTLRINRGPFIARSVFFLPLIAAIFLFGIVLNPPPNLVTWVLFIVIIAFFLLPYLSMILPAIRLTEDRISCRKWFFWKEMEYARITGVRFSYRSSNPVLEISGDAGDRMTLSFGMIISPEHLPVIYDVLKKKSCRADLGKSPEEFFAHPDVPV